VREENELFAFLRTWCLPVEVHTKVACIPLTISMLKNSACSQEIDGLADAACVLKGLVGGIF